MLQFCHLGDNLIHIWDRAKDHTGHGFVVPPQIGDHLPVACQNKVPGAAEAWSRSGRLKDIRA